MPNRNRGRRGTPAVNRGMAIGRAQTPVRARPEPDPIVVIAEAITESQVVSNLHQTSQDHRHTIKQLKERIQDLTKQIKQKNREISNYRGLEQKVASLQKKIETMETPKIQKIKPTDKDVLDLCMKSMKEGKRMSEVFGETLMKIIREGAEELIFEDTGINNTQDFRRVWDILIDCGIVNVIKVNGKITATKIDVYDKERIQCLQERSDRFNDFIMTFQGVVPDYVQVMEDKKETPKGLVKYIKSLKALVNEKNYGELLQQIKKLSCENEQLKQQIEQDDILFEDCQ